jgi:hypothetical protein
MERGFRSRCSRVVSNSAKWKLRCLHPKSVRFFLTVLQCTVLYCGVIRELAPWCCREVIPFSQRVCHLKINQELKWRC